MKISATILSTLLQVVLLINMVDAANADVAFKEGTFTWEIQREIPGESPEALTFHAELTHTKNDGDFENVDMHRDTPAEVIIHLPAGLAGDPEVIEKCDPNDSKVKYACLAKFQREGNPENNHPAYPGALVSYFNVGYQLPYKYQVGPKKGKVLESLNYPGYIWNAGLSKDGKVPARLSTFHLIKLYTLLKKPWSISRCTITPTNDCKGYKDYPFTLPYASGPVDNGVAPYIKVRTSSDYGLDIHVPIPTFIVKALLIDSIDFTIFGRGADPASLADGMDPMPSRGLPYYLRLPTSCETWHASIEVITRADIPDGKGGYFNPQVVESERVAYKPACDEIEPPIFKPSLSLLPDRTIASEPTSYQLKIDQANGMPNASVARAESDIRSIKVDLPAGTTINPAVAEGLSTCPEAQFDEKSEDMPACPISSKIGSVEFRSPLVPSFEGSVFLGPSEAEKGKYKIFLNGRTHGITVKVAGTVTVKTDGEDAGHIVVEFKDLPQLPYSVSMRFKPPGNDMFTNPAVCTSYKTTATLLPWSWLEDGTAGQPINSDPAQSEFTTSGCDNKIFQPQFNAEVDNRNAGQRPKLTATLRNDPGSKPIHGLTVSLPPGLTGYLSSVRPCPDNLATAGTCPEYSRVGSLLAAVGSGGQDIKLPGTVYLKAKQGRDPAGLAFVVPAKVGVFDLKTNVVVSATVKIRESDYGLDVVTEPLPKMVKGIPVNISSIKLKIDRDGFLLNPTNCSTMPFNAGFVADDGDQATDGTVFQVRGCGDLDFSPRIEASIGSKGKVKPGSHMPMSIKIDQSQGQAAMASTSVTLPKDIGVDLKVLDRVCSQSKLAEFACPDSSRIGTVKANTPILAEPLTGGIYVTENKPLPNISLALSGPASLRIDGKTSLTSDKRLRTTFNNLPDVPLNEIDLLFDGSSNGAIVATQKPCAYMRPLEVSVKGQNGALSEQDVRFNIGYTANRNKKLKIKLNKQARRRARGKKFAYVNGKKSKIKHGTVYSSIKTPKDKDTFSVVVKIKSKRGKRSTITKKRFDSCSLEEVKR